MRPNKQFFIVELDLGEQEKRKELIPGTGIQIADTMTDLKFYLQSAPIIAIGEQAHEYFPEAQVGDILIFHHTVEHAEWRQLEKVGNKVKLVVEGCADDCFGIQKLSDLSIIPSRDHVWCKPIKDGLELNTVIETPEGTKTLSIIRVNDEDSLRARITTIQEHIEHIETTSTPNPHQVMLLKQEQAAITAELNKPMAQALKVAIINREASRKVFVEAGDTILMNGYFGYNGYPLSVQGVTRKGNRLAYSGEKEDFILVRTDFLIAKKS